MTNFDPLVQTLNAATAKSNRAVKERLPLDDHFDFEAARRGQIAKLPEGGIDGPIAGRKAWNIADYDFLNDDCPDTVNPSLWRMAQLNAISGLFEVTDGVWQARAFDYANMTIIRGKTGWILVDPLMTKQTSAAALKVVNETLGDRPVSAVILTHTHPDHFGGIRGVIDAKTPPPVYAPEGFMVHAASEGVLGGNHTSRRAMYQFGIPLTAGPEGLVDGGIGKTVGQGERTFVEPSHYISETGAERVIDGVHFIFQMASGTEAPAEFTFLLPDHKVLCMAEVCTQTQHNVLTPRGAQVRDSLLWSRCIDEAATLFGNQAEILINCHNWPVWGTENVNRFLSEQRDIYKYIHDQALRLANKGHTPNEIAETLSEPDWLSNRFHSRGYYGTLSFNARAVYQRYYGFFDGNPVNLEPLSPAALGERFVKAVGGEDAVIALAQEAIKVDDLQWAATVLSHLIFSGSANKVGKHLLTLVYRHQGYRAESGIMRNIYLTGAKELEEGVKPLPGAGGRNTDLAATLSPLDWFDAYALRLNSDKARGAEMVLNFTVNNTPLIVMVMRQTEFTRIDATHPQPDAVVKIKQDVLERLAGGEITLEEAAKQGMVIEGKIDVVDRYFSLHDRFDLWFNVATP